MIARPGRRIERPAGVHSGEHISEALMIARVIRGTLLVVSLSAVLVALPARAWDPDTHDSIARLALILSPAAEARVGGNYAAFYAAVAEPDGFDKLCHSHPGMKGTHEPATIAGQLIDQISSGKVIASKTSRAQMLGRLAHFAADCAVPDVMFGDPSIQPATMWAQTVYTVFREPRPLTAPFADSLRKNGAIARWGDESISNHAYAYRVAVNLVIDALLALPAPAGTAVKDEGPTIFGVDRLDNGMGFNTTGGTNSSYSSTWTTNSSSANGSSYSYRSSSGGGTYSYTYHQTNTGGYYESSYKPYDPGSQLSSSMLKPPTDVEKLHLLELVTRRGGKDEPISVRALFYNNDQFCAGQIALTDGVWRHDVTGGIAPRSVKTAELSMPATVNMARLRPVWTATKCSPPYTAEMGVSALQRVVLNAGGTPPRVDDQANGLMLGK
jgi:hypothetical protein